MKLFNTDNIESLNSWEFLINNFWWKETLHLDFIHILEVEKICAQHIVDTHVKVELYHEVAVHKKKNSLWTTPLVAMALSDIDVRNVWKQYRNFYKYSLTAQH